MTIEEAYKLIFQELAPSKVSEQERKAAEEAFISAILGQEDRLIM